MKRWKQQPLPPGPSAFPTLFLALIPDVISAPPAFRVIKNNYKKKKKKGGAEAKC